MTIESSRLLLKEISWDDIEDIHYLLSYPEVDEFNTMGIPENIEETKDNFRSAIEGKSENPKKSYVWKIALKASNVFIGMAGMQLSCDKLKNTPH